jgi:hypothetical protein
VPENSVRNAARQAIEPRIALHISAILT